MNYYADVLGIRDIIAVRCEEEVKTPSLPGPSSEMMDELERSIEGCTRCYLSKNRTNIVFGEGNVNADLMFIGEGPGYSEDMQGRPFVGKAGQLLSKMIKAMRCRREDVYIANIVKCRPPDNRNPFIEEVEACIGFLKKQIEYVKPSAIVCLGSVATNSLLDTKTPISKMRGKFYDIGCGAQIMPTYHPAYLLRNESMKKHAWEDLQQVMGLLKL